MIEEAIKACDEMLDTYTDEKFQRKLRYILNEDNSKDDDVKSKLDPEMLAFVTPSLDILSGFLLPFEKSRYPGISIDANLLSFMMEFKLIIERCIKIIE